MTSHWLRDWRRDWHRDWHRDWQRAHWQRYYLLACGNGTGNNAGKRGWQWRNAMSSGTAMHGRQAGDEGEDGGEAAVDERDRDGLTRATGDG